jgi:hypothetical protein
MANKRNMACKVLLDANVLPVILQSNAKNMKDQTKLCLTRCESISDPDFKQIDIKYYGFNGTGTCFSKG